VASNALDPEPFVEADERNAGAALIAREQPLGDALLDRGVDLLLGQLDHQRRGLDLERARRHVCGRDPALGAVPRVLRQGREEHESAVRADRANARVRSDPGVDLEPRERHQLLLFDPLQTAPCLTSTVSLLSCAHTPPPSPSDSRTKTGAVGSSVIRSPPAAVTITIGSPQLRHGVVV
jgi:hypothetical protein